MNQTGRQSANAHGTGILQILFERGQCAPVGIMMAELINMEACFLCDADQLLVQRSLPAFQDRGPAQTVQIGLRLLRVDQLSSLIRYA